MSDTPEVGKDYIVIFKDGRWDKSHVDETGRWVAHPTTRGTKYYAQDYVVEFMEMKQ